MEWDAPMLLGERPGRLRVAAASDVGLVRSINEDSFLAVPPVFLVADGMGGHAHGDLASSEVVRVFSDQHTEAAPTTSTAVLASIAVANAAVRQLTGPLAVDSAIAGSTLAGLALIDTGTGRPPSWMAFNVGDSRVYGFQDGVLEQITVDHSAVQELIDRGELSPEDAESHPDRNIVTRAMGVDDESEADVWLIPTGGRQVFLLCSDGLTKELSDARIAQVIEQSELESDFESVADRLVAAAIAAGGKDNVTAVVVDADWTGSAVGGAANEPSEMPAFLEETAPRI